MRSSTQRFANGSFLYTEKSVNRRYELPDNELALSKIVYLVNKDLYKNITVQVKILQTCIQKYRTCQKYTKNTQNQQNAVQPT